MDMPVKYELLLSDIAHAHIHLMGDSTTIGERIRALRTQMGLSQTAFGERVGVGKQAVSQWEHDESVPRPNNLLALANELRVTPHWILYGNEKMPFAKISALGSFTKQPKAGQEIDTDFLSSILRKVLSEIELQGCDFSPEQTADIAAAVYRTYRNPSRPRDAKSMNDVISVLVDSYKAEINWALIRHAGSAPEASIGSKPLGSELADIRASLAPECQGFVDGRVARSKGEASRTDPIGPDQAYELKHSFSGHRVPLANPGQRPLSGLKTLTKSPLAAAGRIFFCQRCPVSLDL